MPRVLFHPAYGVCGLFVGSNWWIDCDGVAGPMGEFVPPVCKMTTCPWKYALGKPGQGFHAPRMFGLAAYDVYGTILIGVVLAFVFDRPRRSFLWVLGAFVTGIIVHWWFCVPTALNVRLGLAASAR